MTAPTPDFPVDGIFGPSLTDVLRERARAIIAYGHGPAADDAKGLEAIGNLAHAFMLIATERAAGTRERRTLPGARTKAVQAVALGLAFIDAIDREMAREGQHHGG